MDDDETTREERAAKEQKHQRKTKNAVEASGACKSSHAGVQTPRTSGQKRKRLTMPSSPSDAKQNQRSAPVLPPSEAARLQDLIDTIKRYWP
jgi:hypothetical protein